MKKLTKISMEERLQKLDKLSKDEVDEFRGGYSSTYGGVDVGITGKPTNRLPPFKNPSVSVGYTF